MNEIKTSKLLAELMEKAKQIGDKRNPPFTAERFLIAAIDAMSDEAEVSGNEELQAVSTMLSGSFPDLAAAKQTLLDHVQDGKSVAFLDDLYMKKKLQEAQQEAEQVNKSEITAVMLLACIVRDPSDSVSRICKKTDTEQKNTEPEVRTGTDGGPSFEDLLKKHVQNAAKPQPEKVQEAEPEAPEAVKDIKAEMAELVTDVRRIRQELQSAVYGQDNAINVFTMGYFQASLLSMIDKSRKRPRATFLFAGPPGVGKTFLAEKIAHSLHQPFVRFDMSEYADSQAHVEFCGSDDIYKNAKVGNVTGFVAKHPKCVLLFDEIEKAHLSIIHLFLQILDAGRLRDNHTDKEVSFADAIIILTTNAGKQLYEEYESGDLSTASRKVIMQALQKDINPFTGIPYFPGAICSRFASGNVVMFNHIGAHHLRFIGKKEIMRHAQNLEKETGIRLQADEDVFTALLLSEGSAADARTVRARAETFFNDELYELLRMIGSEKVPTGIEDVKDIRISLDLSDCAENVRGLFAPSEKPRVLVFAEDGVVSECAEKLPGLNVFGVDTLPDAVCAIKERNIDFVMLDMSCGLPEGKPTSLNIEDEQTQVREFFHFLREQGKGVPVYLLESGKLTLNGEERVSFLRQGVRGILSMTEEQPDFAERVETVASALHQQASLTRLAVENKLITYETAQSVSEDGSQAQIRLFDLKMAVAVDSEDSKSVLNAVSKPNVRFDDVIGARDAKKELAYFVEYLKNPRKYMGTGVKAPKGVLLYGPPGTGKTMLAKAMACEAGVTFIAAEGNQFLKKYVGEGSEKVHELFKTARKYAPAILFVDEIDAIARDRQSEASMSIGGEQTLTAFLTEMDGFVSDPTRPVFVLAATNFDVEPGSGKSLDAALMRRFDRRILIDLPNKEDRIRFLRMKIAKNPALDISDSQIDNLAIRSTGMSLAALDSAVELALRSAIREGSTKVTDAILEEAFETFNSGEVKKWDISQLERVARHEAGHAFLCWHSGQTPSYLTIVARGKHGGYMQHGDQEGKAIYTKDELLARIRISLGGRAAELAYYGARNGISTGASGDLANATNLAQQLVCAYGMDDDFGLAVVSSTAANGMMSAEVRNAINRILKEQMAEATRLIEENKDKIDSLVAELMSQNHMTGPEIERAILKAGG